MGSASLSPPVRAGAALAPTRRAVTRAPPFSLQDCVQQQAGAVFDRDEHGRTPLMLAAAKGQASVLRTVALAGSEVNAVTKGG